MKVNNLSGSQVSVQHFTSNCMENLSFTVPVTHLVAQHLRVAVDDEAKCYDQSVARVYQYEEATSSSPPTEMSPDPLHSSSK